MANYYHVLNRGVDRRKVFLDKQDHLRFIHDLCEFNDVLSSDNVGRTFVNTTKRNGDTDNNLSDLRCRSNSNKSVSKKTLVKIHLFSLMPNHYHLLLSPLQENGISLFMKKVGIGYAKYFNQKYKRVGTLFQGRYKSILIENDRHFEYIPYYIHANPLDLISKEWRKGVIENTDKAWTFLAKYKWSSHLDYLGTKNFPLVTYRKDLTKILEEDGGYKTRFKEWLSSMDSQLLEDMDLDLE